MGKIYIIHENDEWTDHLTNRLDELKVPYETWHLHEGTIDLTATPPEGVYYNRMSASSHTRGHRYAPELAQSVIAWLESHGRTVLNGSDALALEVSKVKQYALLEKFGISTPKTIGAVGKDHIIAAAEKLGTAPFITKHNRAGKGLGVQLFQNIESLKSYVYSSAFEEPIDGITLIQQYIKSDEQLITRAEFIGGKFFYAVNVDTSEGFELCPADACQIGDAFCPVGEQEQSRPKFEVIEEINHEQMLKYEEFLIEAGIDVAGIEFIRDNEGQVYTYDINTNTNYNADAEARVDKYGMLQLAKLLEEKLKQA